MNQPVAVHLGIALGVLLAAVLLVHILRSRRPPATRLGWILFIIVLPYLGIPLYLAFGTRKLSGAVASHTATTRGAGDAFGRLLDSLDVPPATTGNRLTLHRDGEQALASLNDMLRTAHLSVDLCVYQLQDDPEIAPLLDQIAKLASGGIRVRLLVDAVGSWGLSKQRRVALQSAGVQIARFIPVLHRPLRGRTNLRNHRKIVLVDSSAAWTGGRNLAAPYFTDPHAWTDLSLTVRGPACMQLQAVFDRDWAFATGADAPPPPLLSAGSADQAGGHLRVIAAGPDTAGDPVHALLLAAVHAAERRILAVTPYFVPDDCLQQALCIAARRGITVDLVLPARSNHPTADIARSRYLRELHACGARVWMVTPAMVHAKAVVIDDHWALTGSANLDLRSLFLNFELCLMTQDRDQVRIIAQWVDQLRHQAVRHRPGPANALRESLEGMVLLFAYQL